MNVYCGLTEPVYVNDVQAQLLDVIAAQDDSDDEVSITNNKLHYYPFLKKHIADIHKFLRDYTGETIKFETSNVIFDLVFVKKARSQIKLDTTSLAFISN